MRSRNLTPSDDVLVNLAQAKAEENTAMSMKTR